MKKNHLVLLVLFIGVFTLSCSQTTDIQSAVDAPDSTFINQVLENNAEALAENSQVLIVYNDTATSHSAKLTAVEKVNGKWEYVVGIIDAGVGLQGFAPLDQKVEGDKKSPTGIYRIGMVFSYLPQIDTKLNFVQSNDSDKWIDDPQSDDYNKWVRGATTAKSYENLKLSNDTYKYCTVIEYNTDSIVKGKGSAIFFHLGSEKPGGTYGCVSVAEPNMVKILAWLDKAKNPVIIMGNKELLQNASLK